VYHVAYIDVKNIYTPVDVFIRDLNTTKVTVVKPYTKLELSAVYGIPYDYDGVTILTHKSMGYDYAVADYQRNQEMDAAFWKMIVPGIPFDTNTATNASYSAVTLNNQFISNINRADNCSTASEKYYTVDYKLDENLDICTVTEIFVDMSGQPIPDKTDARTYILKGARYDGPSKSITGYDYLGYKQDSWDGSYAPGNLTIQSVDDDMTVYYVYKFDPGVANVTMSKVVTGHFIDKSKDFEFYVYLRYDDGQPLTGTIYYEGATTPGMGAAEHEDGSLNLDNEGKDIVRLKHGQMVTILDLPADAQIRIVETPDSDYRPSFIDSVGACVCGSDTPYDTDFSDVGVNGATERMFTFFNAQKVDPVPTGIVDDLRGTVMLPLIVVPLVFSGWLTIGIIRRHSSFLNPNSGRSRYLWKIHCSSMKNL
jgi:hypothetical protein